MRILLDTHVFIWIINEDDKLGGKSRELVSSTSNELFISYFSFFEMTIKKSLGKLEFDASVMDDLKKMDIKLMYGDKQSLSGYQVFNQKNKDPFDNFLISTAKANNLVFMSGDSKILSTKMEGLELFDALT